MLFGATTGLPNNPFQRQALIWTNHGLLIIRALATKFSKIWIKMQRFSLKKINSEIYFVKYRPFCLRLNVLYGEQWNVQTQKRLLATVTWCGMLVSNKRNSIHATSKNSMIVADLIEFLINQSMTEQQPKYSVFYCNELDTARSQRNTDNFLIKNTYLRLHTGTIVCMGSANERRRYSVASSLIGWAHGVCYLLVVFYKIERSDLWSRCNTEVFWAMSCYFE